jgi:hypothetical protein
MSIACLVCQKRIGTSRGICGPCRRKLREQVRRAETSIEELVARGLLLPAKPFNTRFPLTPDSAAR